MITQDKLNRKKALIERLLAKAAEVTNPHEAEIAMTRAEKMMIQYGFDKAEFTSASKPAEMTTLDVAVKGIYAEVKANMLFRIIREYKTVTTFRKKLGSRLYLTIVGEESDVYDMGQLAWSLMDQSDIAMKQWWTDHPMRKVIPSNEGYKARREFFLGFAVGAAQRVMDVMRSAVAEDTTGGREIVVRDRLARSEEFATEKFNLKRGRRSRIQSSRYETGAYGSGAAAGRNANIGSKAVSV